MTIQSKKLLELSPLSESHQQKKCNKKNAPKTSFYLQNTLCYLRNICLTTNANSPIAPPKNNTFHPTLLLIFVFSKATTTTTTSIATFQSPNPPTHRLHPSGCTPLQCQQVEEASPPSGHLLQELHRRLHFALSDPHFSPRFLASNAALLPQLALLAGGEGHGDDQRRSWEEEVLSKVQAVMGEMDTWHS